MITVIRYTVGSSTPRVSRGKMMATGDGTSVRQTVCGLKYPSRLMTPVLLYLKAQKSKLILWSRTFHSQSDLMMNVTPNV